MTDNVIESSLWATNTGPDPLSVTCTVVFPMRTAVAQASLARITGRGSAQAFIRKYCFQSREMIDCKLASKPEEAPSIIKVGDANRMTFELRVRDTSAYATGLVFLQPSDIPEPIQVRYDFNKGEEGWTAGFADLPPNQEEFYELEAGIRPLPWESVLPATGYFISGNNHSDDLFMFLKRRLGPDDGIQPDQAYRLAFRLVFASNAPTGCFGVGGAPGEDVTLKVGGSAIEPVPIEVNGHLRMNVDKGNQSVGGPAGSVVGDIANGIPCEEAIRLGNPYVSLSKEHTSPFPITSSPTGELWLIVGTDSGFESTTALYSQQIEVRLEPLEATTFPAQAAVTTSVVYVKTSGKIVHIHHHRVSNGEAVPTAAEVEEEAFRLASTSSGKPAASLAALAVQREDLKIGIEYEVDLKEMHLVEKRHQKRSYNSHL